jgi:ketopantoate reductase
MPDQTTAKAGFPRVQNGAGNEEIIARYVPRVIRGTTIVAGSIPAPGVIRLDAPGDTWIGPFEPKPARMDEVRQLAELLTRSGLPATALADSRGAQWTKLIFNAATQAYGHQPSMLQDVATRRGTEIGALTEASSAWAARQASTPRSTRPSPRSSMAWSAPGAS